MSKPFCRIAGEQVLTFSYWMIEFQSEKNKVLFSASDEKMEPFSGQFIPRPFFVQLPMISIRSFTKAIESKLRPQEITPLRSSWPLFLLAIIQLAVAVVAEDRVGQEELLVSVPAVPVFLVSEGTEQAEHEHPKKTKYS